MADDLLQRVLTAPVHEVARETPLDPAPRLSARLGARVLLKREDLQPVFSFKLRGAYTKMARLDAAERARGVIAASAGNHAQGVALAAQRLGCRAVIVMPVTTPRVKVDAVRDRGAEVVLHGDSFSDAQAHAQALQAREGLVPVHPFDDLDVIAGQGTIAMELLRQHPGPIDAVFVAIGGGGMAAGIAHVLKSLRPAIRVIGVQTQDSDAMARSLDAGRRVALEEVGLFSDGTAVKQVGEHTFALCQRHLDGIVRVDTDAVCAAIKDVFEDTRAILEPAGALAIAGLKAWRAGQAAADAEAPPPTLVAVACGANMNFDRLRFVSERAEMGERREAVFAVRIPERPGSFRAFCEAVGPRNVTEFNYRVSDAAEAHVFVGLQVAGRDEARAIAAGFEARGFATLDLSDDELAKLHLRHLVGGRSPLAAGERLLRFEFPERPGALLRFLERLPAGWNIALFHYRNHGADTGRALVGLQAPGVDAGAFATVLDGLGLPWVDEGDNPAYRLFLAPAAG